MIHKYIPSRIFFNSINSNIRTIGTGIESLFNIIDINNVLNYSKVYLKKYYCHKLKDGKVINNEYVDIKAITNILNRGRKPNCKKLLQEILIQAKIQYSIIMPERIEIDIYNSINDFYYDYDNIEIITNKYVDGYYTDIVIKKNNCIVLIIEINEMNHSFCAKRMEKIKKALKCENFLNINPHDTNFSTGKLIKKISEYV